MFILSMDCVQRMDINLECISVVVYSRANVVQKRLFEVHVESDRRK
jgi:hypothetical protein